MVLLGETSIGSQQAGAGTIWAFLTQPYTSPVSGTIQSITIGNRIRSSQLITFNVAVYEDGALSSLTLVANSGNTIPPSEEGTEAGLWWMDTLAYSNPKPQVVEGTDYRFRFLANNTADRPHYENGGGSGARHNTGLDGTITPPASFDASGWLDTQEDDLWTAYIAIETATGAITQLGMQVGIRI